MIDFTFLIGAAGNVVWAENASYTSSDFYDIFPQFEGKIPEFVLAQFIAMAQNTVLEARWHSNWKWGMALFIAHMCTTYLGFLTCSSADASAIIEAAQTRGLVTSKSVGPLSLSYDISVLVSDLKGWIGFKSTMIISKYFTISNTNRRKITCRWI